MRLEDRKWAGDVSNPTQFWNDRRSHVGRKYRLIDSFLQFPYSVVTSLDLTYSLSSG